MICGIMLDLDEEEERRLCCYFSELTAFCTDEKLEIRKCRNVNLFFAEIKKMDLLDMAIIDVTIPEALAGARMIRNRFPAAEILVIADTSVSPMEYMHPSIRASSLLLRPMPCDWKKAVHDFFEQFLMKNTKKNHENVLWVENRNGTYRIPFKQICYLEAREKKVFIRTRTEEYGISGTIEKFQEKLPGNFVRCHRSYIVNREYISHMKLNENLLYLGEDLFVPVSRSYKDIFKRRSNE